MVQLTAPETYGEWRFHQWADAFGAPLPGGANPTILLNMSRDSAVTAQYILPGVVAPTLQLPVLSGSTLLLRWAGGRGILLQSAGTINGPWTDVPGSEGVSQLSVSTAPGQGFFRAVQR
jgi:hypothetical protein